jgi:rhodanese-related sulfurtransferase
MAARIEQQYPDVRHLRPEEVVFSSGGRPQQQQKQQLVDTRTAAERRVSVLPGAIPLSELERRLVLDEPEDSNVEYVLYCTIGKRSSDEVRRLSQRHPKAAPRLCNLRGSVLAWAHAGLPLADENSKSIHCYASPWALLPEGYEPVVFSPWGLLMATLRPQG